jgi:hypothetical protein
MLIKIGISIEKRAFLSSKNKIIERDLIDLPYRNKKKDIDCAMSFISVTY